MRFVPAFCLSALATIAAVAALNWTVDPFNALGRNTLGVYADTERTAKAWAVTTFPHDGLILGSSVVARADPRHVRGGRFFNAAFASAVPEEFLWFLDNYLQPGKTVVIALDFAMINKGYFNLFFNSRTLSEAFSPDPYGYLLSTNVAANSLRTIVDAWRGEPPEIREDGGRPKIYSGASDTRALEEIPIVPIGSGRYQNFDYAVERIDILRRTKRLMDERNARYALILVPVHDAVRRSLKLKGLDRHLKRLRADLADIFGSCFHDASAGRYSRPRHFDGTDLNHVFSAVGEKLLSDVVTSGALCGKTS